MGTVAIASLRPGEGAHDAGQTPERGSIGDRHDGVPIHVLTHHVDEGDVPPGSAKFYTDVVSCATEARAAAGDRAVMAHGAGAAQALLQAGQLDELEIHLVPVLLGAGRRLFETGDSNHIELQLIRRLEGREATHLRYRATPHLTWPNPPAEWRDYLQGPSWFRRGWMTSGAYVWLNPHAANTEHHGSTTPKGRHECLTSTSFVGTSQDRTRAYPTADLRSRRPVARPGAA